MTQTLQDELLASIDAELDQLALPDVAPGQHADNPADDQATALRRLVAPSQSRGAQAPGAPRPAFIASTQPKVPSPRPKPSPQFTPDRTATLLAARQARVVAVASGKGGVGKSNIAVNTAIHLAKRGLRVTLLDADLGTANADVLCGITPPARLDHVLAPGGLRHQDGATLNLSDIAIDAPGGFTLIPGSAGIGRMADLTALERRWLVSGIVELAAQADILLIDAAAGVGQGVTSLLHAADLALVVTTPEPTAVADAYALIKCLVMEEPASHAGAVAGGSATASPSADDGRISLIVNQVTAPVEAFATHARMARVCDRFLGLKLPMLGFVAQDVRVPEAVRAQVPLALRSPASPAARSVSDLAGAIINTLGVRPQSSGKAPGPANSRAQSRGVGALVRRLLGFSPGSENATEKV